MDVKAVQQDKQTNQSIGRGGKQDSFVDYCHINAYVPAVVIFELIPVPKLNPTLLLRSLDVHANSYRAGSVMYP